MEIEAVCRVLDGLGSRYALIGAHAMAARGYPRFTVDVDLMTMDARVLDRSTWTPIEREVVSIDARRGDIDDPLGGVVHLLLADGTDVDIILGKWQWEADLLQRAEPMTVRPGLTLRVPAVSDLILMKIVAGGFVDRQDAAALLRLGDWDRLAAEVEARLPGVPSDARAEWDALVRGEH